MKARLRTILALLALVLSASCAWNPTPPDPLVLAQCDAQYPAESLRQLCYKKAWHDANTMQAGPQPYYGGLATNPAANAFLHPQGPQAPQLVIPNGNGFLITR